MKILNICISLFLINAFFACQSAYANEHVESKKCVNSIPIIFDTGKVRCLSDFPLLSDIKIQLINSTVVGAARKFKIYSFAQSPDYGTRWHTWNNERESTNDERALEGCQKALDEKLSKLEYKRSGDAKCLLILSAKSPSGTLRVAIPEERFIEIYGSFSDLKVNSTPTQNSLDSQAPLNISLTSNADIANTGQVISPQLQLSNRRALVIGNDAYKSIPKLLAAREDARTVASNLSAMGYQVTLKLDLNEKDMKSALRTFASQVQGGDEVMFFFAGHGVQLGSANYLLPTDIVGDSEAQVRDEAIQLQRVLDDMSEKKAKFTLAMIDACRDNPFKTTGRAIGGRGLAPTTAATGQMVIFSAGTGQQALDRLGNSDKNKNGLFTRVFVQEMQKPNLSIDRVVKNVRNQVAELAKSVGHEQVPAIYDQVLGDFYFKK